MTSSMCLVLSFVRPGNVQPARRSFGANFLLRPNTGAPKGALGGAVWAMGKSIWRFYLKPGAASATVREAQFHNSMPIKAELRGTSERSLRCANDALREGGGNLSVGVHARHAVGIGERGATDQTALGRGFEANQSVCKRSVSAIDVHDFG
jgi:hypothetical protein